MKFWFKVGAFNVFLFTIIIFLFIIILLKSIKDFNIGLFFISTSGLIAWVIIIINCYKNGEDEKI